MKRITIMLNGVSTNGTANPVIQIGDSGGIEATGYLGSMANIGSGVASATNFTIGFGIFTAAASVVMHGTIVLTLQNAATFAWTAAGMVGLSDNTFVCTTAGRKLLSAELDRVRITTSNGTDAFDAGLINISYE